MQETDCKQVANTLHVSFCPQYNNQNELTSREFVLCGLVTVQIKTVKISEHNSSSYEFQMVYITSTKTFESDHLTFFIEVSSIALKFSQKNFIVDLEGSQPFWHILHKKNNFIKEFDIKINLQIDTSPKTNPAFTLLYDDNELTDFQLRGQDGTVQVHKAVLASISPVMNTMLRGEWKEVETGIVDIPNTTKETLQQLKDYMYLKKLPESGHGLENLAALASCYMMTDFEELCTVKLLLTLTRDNVEDLLDFAVKYRMKKFKVTIIFAIIKHASVEFTDLIKNLEHTE